MLFEPNHHVGQRRFLCDAFSFHPGRVLQGIGGGMMLAGTFVSMNRLFPEHLWIKVVAARNLGLNKRAKMLGLLIVAIGFAFLVTEFTNVPTTLSFTRWDNPGWDLGRIGWMVWAVPPH